MTGHDRESGFGEGPRILLIGDSIACGLGVYGRSFGRIAAEQLGAAEVLDLTGISVSVGETLEHAQEIRDFGADLAILGCGTTESLVHPGPVVQQTIERFAPASWHGEAGLEPRPYFSGNARRRLGQRVTAVAKAIVKRSIIRLTGGGRRISVDDFAVDLARLVALLEEVGCPMVFVGMSKTDASLFPQTNRALNDTQAVLARQLSGRRDTVLLDPGPSLDYWEDFLRDRLHLNDSGHHRLAEAIVVASERLQPAKAGV